MRKEKRPTIYDEGQVLQYDNLDDMRIAWHAHYALNFLEPFII